MSISSPDATQGHTTTEGLPMPYRAEYNVLSGRWMVLDANDGCYAAGLSQHAANSTVLELINAKH